MKYYSIQAVSEMSGLSSHCIRAWEKRYGAIKPERSDNGRRVYSEAELLRLQLLGKLSSLGNSISLIANLPDDELQNLYEKMSNGKGFGSSTKLSKSLIDPNQYLNNLFLALSTWNLEVFTHELSKASMDLTYKDFALKVVAGLFRKVGDYVAEGKMSIAQEHTLSALTKFYVGKRVGQHYLQQPKSKFKILMATPRGELHSIGLLLTSLLMCEHSLSFIFLGEDLPEESIAEAAKATESDAILLSVSPVYSGRNNGINEVSMNLRRLLSDKTQIWMGGAVDQLHASTIRENKIMTFTSLESLDSHLARIVAAE